MGKRCPWIFKLPHYPTHPENVSSSQWHGGHPSCDPVESLSPTRGFPIRSLSPPPQSRWSPLWPVLNRSAVPHPTRRQTHYGTAPACVAAQRLLASAHFT